ncbi:MAG TPA: purine-nucleoside phosphorylase [Anaerolineales bacterium]|nr:purine-nucleoside phosphorylase [Anaerolineales bacterium]
MSAYFSLEQFQETVDAVRGRTEHRPTVGMILGTGLGSFADEVQAADRLSYSELPHWPESTVEGHAGRLVIGELDGHTVLVMQGRSHYYEGYTMAQIGLPVRVMQLLGVQTLLITNAAGGVNPGFNPGDLMLITDHVNLLGMGGLNPLRGANIDSLGPRFPDMMDSYDPELRAIAVQAAEGAGIGLQQGVYVSLAGPNFETPADLRFLQAIGADAVGMSTVPEVIVARHGGTRVLGFSGISNKANLDGKTPTTHEEVLQAGRVIVPKLLTLIGGVLRAMR